ncbi:NAD(P)-binding protein [Infundibulicybe gibba]|nr:NAD(P)-binding protein [Infundibulicybe gibba]
MPTTTSRRVAIVTGAAQGIGRAIALRLADDGHDVAVNDLKSRISLLEATAAEIKAKGGRVIITAADVSVEKEVQDMVQQTVNQLGGLDVMVANAGVAVMTSILDTSMEEWERIFSINVKGTLLCYKTAAKVMIDQGRGGRIIGACSLAGKKSAAMCSTYGSSKFAIRSLTQVAACEWGKFGITVNGYAPGLTDTPLLEQMDARVGEIMGVGPGAYIEMMKPQTALGRVGEADEVAKVVSFFASKESAFVTGQTLAVDGGIWFD